MADDSRKEIVAAIDGEEIRRHLPCDREHSWECWCLDGTDGATDVASCN